MRWMSGGGRGVSGADARTVEDADLLLQGSDLLFRFPFVLIVLVYINIMMADIDGFESFWSSVQGADRMVGVIFFSWATAFFGGFFSFCSGVLVLKKICSARLQAPPMGAPKPLDLPSQQVCVQMPADGTGTIPGPGHKQQPDPPACVQMPADATGATSGPGPQQHPDPPACVQMPADGTGATSGPGPQQQPDPPAPEDAWCADTAGPPAPQCYGQPEAEHQGSEQCQESSVSTPSMGWGGQGPPALVCC